MNFRKSPRATRRFSRWQTSKRTFVLGTNKSPSVSDKPVKKIDNVEIDGKLTNSNHPDKQPIIAAEKEHAVINVLQNTSNHQSLDSPVKKFNKGLSYLDSSEQTVPKRDFMRKTFESIAIHAIEDNQSVIISSETNDGKDVNSQDPVTEKENDESKSHNEASSSLSNSRELENVSAPHQSDENLRTDDKTKSSEDSSLMQDVLSANDKNSNSEAHPDSLISESETATSKNVDIQEDNQNEIGSGNNTIELQNVQKIVEETSVLAVSQSDNQKSDKDCSGPDVHYVIVQEGSSSISQSVDSQDGLKGNSFLKKRNSTKEPPVAHDPVEFGFNASTNENELAESSLKSSNVSKPDSSSSDNLVTDKRIGNDNGGGSENHVSPSSTNKFACSETKRSNASQHLENSRLQGGNKKIVSQPCASSSEQDIVSPEQGNDKTLPSLVNQSVDSGKEANKNTSLRNRNSLRKPPSSNKKLRNKKLVSQPRASSSEQDIVTPEQGNNKTLPSLVNQSVDSGKEANRNTSLRNRNSLRKPPSSLYPTEFLSSSKVKLTSKSNIQMTSRESNAEGCDDEMGFTASLKEQKQSKESKNRKRSQIQKGIQIENSASIAALDLQNAVDNTCSSTTGILSRDSTVKVSKTSKKVGDANGSSQEQLTKPKKENKSNKSHNSRRENDNDVYSVELQSGNSSSHKNESSRGGSLRQRDSIRKPPSSQYPKKFVSSSQERSVPVSKTRKMLFSNDTPGKAAKNINDSNLKRKSPHQSSIEESQDVNSMIPSEIDNKKGKKSRNTSSNDKSMNHDKLKMSKSSRKNSYLSGNASPENEIDNPVDLHKTNVDARKDLHNSKAKKRTLSISPGTKRATKPSQSRVIKVLKNSQAKVKNDKKLKNGDITIASPPEQQKNTSSVEQNCEKSLSSIDDSSSKKEDSLNGSRSLRNRNSIRKPPSTCYPVEYLLSNQAKALLLSKKKSNQKDECPPKPKGKRKANEKRKYQLPRKKLTKKVLDNFDKPHVPDTITDSTLHNSPSLVVIDPLKSKEDATVQHSKIDGKDRRQADNTIMTSEANNISEVCSSQALSSQPLEDTFHGIHKIRRKRNLFSDSEVPSHSQSKVAKKGQSDQPDELLPSSQKDSHHSKNSFRRNTSKSTTKVVSRKPENTKSKKNLKNARGLGNPVKRKTDSNGDQAIKIRQGAGLKTKDISEWMSSYHHFIKQLALS